MGRITVWKGCGLAVLAAALWMAQAYAREGAVPLARGEVIRDYARITFEWPETVYFTADADGRTLSITFDRAANPDFRPLLARLSPYVKSAERKRDGRTLVLTLDKPYRIRTFISDNVGGVDLLDIHSKRRPPTQLAKAKKKPEPVAVAEAKNPEPAKPTPIETRLAALAALSPAAGEEKPVEATPAPAEPVPIEPAAAVETPAAPQAASEPVAVAAPQEAPEELGDGAMLGGAAPVADPSGPLKVSVSAAKDSAVLRFPFAERMAMAVFVRGHALWVVMGEKVPLSLSDFDALPPTVIGKPELVAADGVTVMRIPVDEGVYVNVAREENSHAWAILLTETKRMLARPLDIAIRTDPPAPPHVFISTLEVSAPVAVNDPQVGDELIVAPIFAPGEGVAAERDFVEFTLLATAQGVAVSKKADEVQMAQLRNGLRVSLPQGATLTSGLPEIEPEKAGAALSLATLFPYDAWKADDPENSRKQAQELFQHSVMNEPQAANAARLRLAQLYLSDGRAAEAMALLDGVRRVNPSFYRSSKLAALRGAANFLMARFPDAARDFSASELNNNREVEYWRAMLADLLGAPAQSYDYLSLNADYISKYPPVFRQRLAIVSADRAIGAKEYNAALKIFDTLKEDNLLDPINTYINYLLAMISAATGQEKEAFETWDKLATDYDHPFVRARAEFSRIVWGMDHEKLPKDEAIERLERLRLAWHGDSLELKVLTLLGELYIERKDYINAMRVWNGGVMSFTHTAAAHDMSRKMQEAFITMFNEGIADGLPPLEALALYYEYRNYTPPGKTGNDMIERLADRLVAVDLLEQAAVLLDHQMRYQVEKEDRSRLGVKLATVHLLNHQPQKALKALQDSLYGENSLLLRLQRNRLTAQALVELNQPEKALQVLGQDTSEDADHIRLSVYWRQKDWPRLIEGVEAMLKARPDTSAPITLGESEYLLKLALAYVFQNNSEQLAYLRDYFGPLMEGNPNGQVFDFIAGGDIKLTTTNFDEVLKNLSDTRSFIENYRARIQTAGLGEMTKEAP